MEAAAEAAWRRLEADDVHWAERIGCFRMTHFVQGVRDVQEEPVKFKNRHERALRRALVEVSAHMWRRRDEQLSLLV